MKNTTFGLVALLCLLSSTVVAAQKIEFVGEISQYTCKPTVNGNENGTVVLPVVATTDFALLVPLLEKPIFRLIYLVIVLMQKILC